MRGTGSEQLGVHQCGSSVRPKKESLPRGCGGHLEDKHLLQVSMFQKSGYEKPRSQTAATLLAAESRCSYSPAVHPRGSCLTSLGIAISFTKWG